MTADIVRFVPKTFSSEIKSKIIEEITRLKEKNCQTAPKSSREAILGFADVMEADCIYLAEIDDPRLEPVIESKVSLIAKIRLWLA
ncbi:MAG: hypothetical protein AB2705_22300 [Candidatus Thiodiazotropha sp.]